jgi:hypothetical protein
MRGFSKSVGRGGGNEEAFSVGLAEKVSWTFEGSLCSFYLN